jgi:hypothetical protein
VYYLSTLKATVDDERMGNGRLTISPPRASWRNIKAKILVVSWVHRRDRAEGRGEVHRANRIRLKKRDIQMGRG